MHTPFTEAAATYFASVSAINALLRSGDIGQLFWPPYGHLKREKEHVARWCIGRVHTRTYIYPYITTFTVYVHIKGYRLLHTQHHLTYSTSHKNVNVLSPPTRPYPYP